MGGHVILLREAFPPEHADSCVRIEQILMAMLYVVHRAQRFFIAETASPDIVADGLQIVIVEIDDTREIAGISDIHSVGDSVAGSAWNQFSASQKIGKHVLCVGRGHEFRKRQAHALCQDARPQISEIFPWDTESPPFCTAGGARA